MPEVPIFSAPTAKPGEVRLYGNRIEIERRKLFGRSTRTIFLRELRDTKYGGGRTVSLGLPYLTAAIFELKRKEDARALIDRLNELIGR